MPEARQTTIRFTDEVYVRLEEANRLTGLPINSIVVVACLEWLDLHQPENLEQASRPWWLPRFVPLPGGRRHVPRFIRGRGMFPFDLFSEQAKSVLTTAQSEAEGAGHTYIGTEHLLLALLAVPEGLAYCALNKCRVTEEAVRSRLDVVVNRGRSPLKQILPTSRVKKVVEIAFDLASADSQEGDEYVGTQHLLRGLLTEGEGVAGRVLKELASEAEIQEAIQACLKEKGAEHK